MLDLISMAHWHPDPGSSYHIVQYFFFFFVKFYSLFWFCPSDLCVCGLIVALALDICWFVGKEYEADILLVYYIKALRASCHQFKVVCRIEFLQLFSDNPFNLHLFFLQCCSFFLRPYYSDVWNVIVRQSNRNIYWQGFYFSSLAFPIFIIPYFGLSFFLFIWFHLFCKVFACDCIISIKDDFHIMRTIHRPLSKNNHAFACVLRRCIIHKQESSQFIA